MQSREKSQLLSQGLWSSGMIIAWGAGDLEFDSRKVIPYLLIKKNVSAVIQSTKKWNFVSDKP